MSKHHQLDLANGKHSCGFRRAFAAMTACFTMNLCQHAAIISSALWVFVCMCLELWGTWRLWWNAVGETPGWAVKRVPKQGNGESSSLISHISQARWREVLRWWILPSLITDCNIPLPPFCSKPSGREKWASHLDLILLGCILYTILWSGCFVCKR